MKVGVDHPKTSKVNFIETVAKPHSMLPEKTLVSEASKTLFMDLWRGPSKTSHSLEKSL